MATLATLSAAQGINDQTLLLSALTGVITGGYLLVDGEVEKVLGLVPAAATTPVSVLRGQEGTFNQAHPISAQVKVCAGMTALVPGDFGAGLPGAPGAFQIPIPPIPVTERRSYSAAGAITLPSIGNHMIAELNGAVALAMTLANPSIAQDGSRLLISGNGQAAHTVTYAAGLGNVGATADVLTFVAGQAQSVELVASGGFWQNTSIVAGAATLAGPGAA
jgi:hypothetical protein